MKTYTLAVFVIILILFYKLTKKNENFAQVDGVDVNWSTHTSVPIDLLSTVVHDMKIEVIDSSNTILHTYNGHDGASIEASLNDIPHDHTGADDNAKRQMSFTFNFPSPVTAQVGLKIKVTIWSKYSGNSAYSADSYAESNPLTSSHIVSSGDTPGRPNIISITMDGSGSMPSGGSSGGGGGAS
jgi:uncharacterized membrane protein YgcG